MSFLLDVLGLIVRTSIFRFLMILGAIVFVGTFVITLLVQLIVRRCNYD